jgi:hypothetical protein
MAAFTKDGKRILTMWLIGGKAIKDKNRYEARFWDANTLELGCPV